MKKITTLMLISLLMFTSITQSYATIEVDETIYINLNHDGSHNSMSAVTHTFNTETMEDNYHQLDIRQEIPYNFSITYTLDGVETDPQTLAGESGFVEISLNVLPNPKAMPIYHENMMVQLGLTLNLDDVDNVLAPDATAVVSGRTMSLNYVNLPNTTSTYELSFYTNEFTMDGITASILPYSMSAPDDLTHQVEEIETGFLEMSDGVEDLIEGSQTLQDGMYDLSDGMTQSYDGYTIYNDGIVQLVDGLSPFLDGISPLSDGVTELTLSSTQLTTALTSLSANSTALNESYGQITDAYKELASSTTMLTQLASAYETHDDANIAAMANGLINLNEGLNTLNTQFTMLNTNALEFTEGLTQLSVDYTSFDAGLSIISDNLATLSFASGDIKHSLEPILTGGSDLKEGFSTLHEILTSIPTELTPLIEGQEALLNGIHDASSTISTSIDGFSSPGLTLYPSFIDNQREDVKSLQFILKTPEITKIEVKDVIPDIEEEKSFLDRLLDLFR